MWGTWVPPRTPYKSRSVPHKIPKKDTSNIASKHQKLSNSPGFLEVIQWLVCQKIDEKSKDHWKGKPSRQDSQPGVSQNQNVGPQHCVRQKGSNSLNFAGHQFWAMPVGIEENPLAPVAISSPLPPSCKWPSVKTAINSILGICIASVCRYASYATCWVRIAPRLNHQTDLCNKATGDPAVTGRSMRIFIIHEPSID